MSGAESVARAFLRPFDVAVHIRCFPFFTSDYPLPAFSLFRALPSEFATSADLRFLLIAGALGPSCGSMVGTMSSFLKRHYPQAAVLQHFNTTTRRGVLSESLVDVAGGDTRVEADFALLLFAPLLIRTPSSFSLWPALARGATARTGNQDGLVLSLANPTADTEAGWTWADADFGEAWKWIEVPFLTSAIIAQEQFDFENPQPWIKWLETH